MTQHRCLNCGDYKRDELDIDGNQMGPFDFPNAGVCRRNGERKKDGWACGEWFPSRYVQ